MSYSSFLLVISHRLVPTLVDAWKYRHLDDSFNSSPLPVSRIPTAENRPLRYASGGLSHLAYSPAIRNNPGPIRPRRSASTNDMYTPSANPAAIALQNLKGDKPTAIIKEIRRSSLINDDSGVSYLRPLRGNSSNNVTNGPTEPAMVKQRVTRRKSSSEIEIGKTTLLPLHQFSRSPIEKDRIKREPIRPALSILTDDSVLGEHQLVAQGDDEGLAVEFYPKKEGSSFGDSFGEIGEGKDGIELSRPQGLIPQSSVRTRIFEYNERNELVEVDVDTLEGLGDDEAYDEEYIEVVYEDVDDGVEDVEDEVHIYEAPSEVASHITWM